MASHSREITIDRSVSFQVPVIRREPARTPNAAHGDGMRREGIHPARRKTFRESVLRIGDIEGHGGNRLYNVFMDTIVVLVTTLEITVVLYLSYSHFHHARGMAALAMLLPILLNFIGGTYFLSDPVERQELEKCGQPCKCAADFLQFPVLGPVFTAIRVLSISMGCSTHINYERLEASAIKMRQAGGFFTAAPEAVVQLSVILIRTTSWENLGFDAYLEMFAVGLFTLSLAESNCYNPLSDYYKMFAHHYDHEWHLRHVSLWEKVTLFLHALFSMASRIMAVAMLNASIIYICEYHDIINDTPFALVLVFFAQVAYKLVLHYICQIVYFVKTTKEVPSGCYNSINYAWRSTILNYGFQSENVFEQLFFYIENAIFYGFWMYTVKYQADADVTAALESVMTIAQLALTVLSVVFLLICSTCNLVKLQNPFV